MKAEMTAMQAAVVSTNKSSLSMNDKMKIDQMFASRKDGVTVFTTEELELIACACKESLGQVTKSIKKTKDLIEKQNFSAQNEYIEVYLNGLKQDLIARGEGILNMLESDCIEVTGAPKAMIFFTKLQADTARYICDHVNHPLGGRYRSRADMYYQKAAWMFKTNKNNIIQNEE